MSGNSSIFGMYCFFADNVLLPSYKNSPYSRGLTSTWPLSWNQEIKINKLNLFFILHGKVEKLVSLPLYFPLRNDNAVDKQDISLMKELSIWHFMTYIWRYLNASRQVQWAAQPVPDRCGDQRAFAIVNKRRSEKCWKVWLRLRNERVWN